MKNKKPKDKKGRSAIEQQEAAIRANAKMKLRFTNAVKSTEDNQTTHSEHNQFR